MTWTWWRHSSAVCHRHLQSFEFAQLSRPLPPPLPPPCQVSCNPCDTATRRLASSFHWTQTLKPCSSTQGKLFHSVNTYATYLSRIHLRLVVGCVISRPGFHCSRRRLCCTWSVLNSKFKSQICNALYVTMLQPFAQGIRLRLGPLLHRGAEAVRGPRHREGARLRRVRPRAGQRPQDAADVLVPARSHRQRTIQQIQESLDLIIDTYTNYIYRHNSVFILGN